MDPALRRSARFKQIVFAVTTAVVTLTTCVLLAESAVRRFAPQSSLRQRDLFFRYEPFVGAEGIPNKRGVFANASFTTTIEHNSEGLRDTEHTKANREGKFRILTVGDSFTWGHGVDNEEIYMKVLERLDDRVETINLGGPGGDPPGELKVYTKRGREYEHDVILVGFYIGNDVVTRRPSPDGSPPDWGFDERGEFTLIGIEKSPEQVAQIRRESEIRYSPTAERSAPEQLGFWLRQHLQLLTLIDNQRDYASEVWAGSVLYTSILRFVGREPRREFPLLDYCTSEDSEAVAFGWQLAEATLRTFEQMAADSRARLLVLVIPDMYQIWTDYYETTARRYGYDPDAYDLDKPNRKLRSICDALEIACVDLLPIMREHARNGEALYYRRDRHWTPAGHRVAAHALREDLEQRAWID